MRVLKIGIKNFRSYGVNQNDEDGFHWLDLSDDIVFLIGQNDAGKSTVLHAYQKLYTSKTTLEKSDFFNRSDVEVEICAEISATDEELEEENKVRSNFNSEKIAIVKKVWQIADAPASVFSKNPDTNEWGPFGGFDSILQNRLPYPHFLSGFDEPDTLSGILAKVVSGLIKSVVQETDDYNSTVQQLKKLSEIIDKQENLVEVSEKISNSFELAFPGSKIHISNPPNEDKIAAIFDKQINVDISYPSRGMTETIPLRNVGHGLQRHFILSAIQATSEIIQQLKKKSNAKEGGLLLIEEPELFLHPSKLRDIQSILYQIASETNFQVVAATHSPVLVDLSRKHQTLARVRHSGENGSYIFQIDSDLFDEEERDRLAMVNRFNPHVAEAFFAEEVILVEGDTEATTFKTLIERLKERADPRQLNIHVINCMGKHTIPLFQRVLTHFRIEYYVVHDLDTEILKVEITILHGLPMKKSIMS